MRIHAQTVGNVAVPLGERIEVVHHQKCPWLDAMGEVRHVEGSPPASSREDHGRAPRLTGASAPEEASWNTTDFDVVDAYRDSAETDDSEIAAHAVDGEVEVLIARPP